jgi:glutamate transport system substrate-binding protein
MNRTLAMVVAVLTAALTACGGSSGRDNSPIAVDKTASFPADSTMARLQRAGEIRIGVKYDQPGLSFRKPGTDMPAGFDIEIGKMIAARLGIEPAKIRWVETVAKNREPFIQNGTVDLVVASYSITEQRREVIGQAGPYYVTGQQLLVRKDDATIKGPESLPGKQVCAVTGSTSIKAVEEYRATVVPFATWGECVTQLLNKRVDAVTTDGAILLGYAAEDPERLQVVGRSFSKEGYGIGFKKGEQPFCEFLRGVLTKSFTDGSWQKSFDGTLGKSGVAAQPPSAVDAACWR